MSDDDAIVNADPRKLMFWQTLSLIALPLVVIMSIFTFTQVKEKAKRPREPFLNLPYMCRRTKPFPWGDGNHTLFHNPVKNPVPPHGYEVEDPYAVYKKTAN
ncbi:Cytochrome c oxidase subunit 6A1, mitochondrial [Ooceraea biroi]|uniref:Cytochrome c oxidase subunit 6A1, mitochondrial n=1 Tax=Ooceraea biroi TaxID=2015173 RepID=A0A026VXE0_OOCBI|nr:Cytochrome c oxidase subunit 6A1, mitochondrial [Ooceraea biroi]